MPRPLDDFETCLVPDVLTHGLRLVFCGTALSRVSYAARAYYANPGNRFWPTLHRCGFTPHLVKPQDYQTISAYGLGLTDLCKTAFGNDADLRRDQFDREGLHRKIMEFQPDYLGFTSKNAARFGLGRPIQTYGLQPEILGRTRIFVLPSTSGLARGFWDEGPWQELAALLPLSQ